MVQVPVWSCLDLAVKSDCDDVRQPGPPFLERTASGMDLVVLGGRVANMIGEEARLPRWEY